MAKIDATGHFGMKLFLFRCPNCSGIWTDNKVIFRLDLESALEIEPDVEWEEISTTPREKSLSCPRCRNPLIEQTGVGLPKGLRIDSCMNCGGFWFDKGELMIYKSYLEKRRDKVRKKLEEENAHRKMLEEAMEKLKREINFWFTIGGW
jgi:Zn-finger nucleic acid-binding protein